MVDNSVKTIGILKLLPKDKLIMKFQNNSQCYYEDDLPYSVMFPTDYRMWFSKWRQLGSGAPQKLMDVLSACDEVTFCTS